MWAFFRKLFRKSSDSTISKKLKKQKGVGKKLKAHEWSFRVGILLAALLIITYFLPSPNPFNFTFGEGEPWHYAPLYSSYKFNINMSDSVLQVKQDSVKKDFEPYFTKQSLMQDSVKMKIRRAADKLSESNPKYSSLLVTAYLHSLFQKIDSIYDKGVMSQTCYDSLMMNGTREIRIVDNNIANFADMNEVYSLQTAYKKLMSPVRMATEGIDTDKVTTAVDTLNALSLIEPPDKPGLLDFLTGKGSLESFATQMTYLADGFAKYAEKTGADNLNYGNIEKSRTVIEQLAEVQNLIDPDGGLMGVIGGTKKEAFAGLAANMEGLGSGVAAFCKNLNDGNPNFSNTDKAIGVIQSFGEVYNKLPNIGGFFSWFSGDVKLEDFANKIPLLGTAIAGFANSLGDATLGENVQQAADYIDKFARIQSKIKTPGDMQLDTFAGQVQQSITRLVEINRTVSAEGFSFNDDAFNKMIGYLTSFKDIAVQMRDFKTNENVDFKKFGEQIKGFFEELQKLATDYGVLGAKSFNDEKLKNMTDGIKAPFEAFRDAFNSLKEASTGDLSLSSLVTQILNDGLTALKDEGKKAEYKDAGASLVESIQNGVKSKNIKTETSNIAIEGSNEIKTDRDIWDAYVSAGKYLVDGLAEGLKNWDSAVEAAKKLAQEVLSTIQNTTDEHSPSKKTMEYGMYLSEGLAIGIEKYGFMANTAAGNIARMVLGTMDRTISNHNTSYDFGITPVLDSSNIGTYTNTLAQYRSEWDTVNRMHLPAVSKIAESMDVNVNDRYANTMESFRSDIADLGDRITSMRVVMDTGTVVGELAPGMDAALGRRANYSTRRIS